MEKSMLFYTNRAVRFFVLFFGKKKWLRKAEKTQTNKRGQKEDIPPPPLCVSLPVFLSVFLLFSSFRTWPHLMQEDD